MIHVPRHAELTNILTSNGAIHVDNIDGNAHLKTSNGGIRATAIRGSVDAVSSNGTLEITDVVGDLLLRTSNGGIKADVKKGGFDARTTNGSITARLTEPDSKPVRLESSNGHIELTMDAAREVHADTSNSSITVRMPNSAGANSARPYLERIDHLGFRRLRPRRYYPSIIWRAPSGPADRCSTWEHPTAASSFCACNRFRGSL